MALKGISNVEHRRLFTKLKALEDEDAGLLASLLDERYLNYQEVIRKLEQVIFAYEEVAAVAHKRKSKVLKHEFFQ